MTDVNYLRDFDFAERCKNRFNEDLFCCSNLSNDIYQSSKPCWQYTDTNTSPNDEALPCYTEMISRSASSDDAAYATRRVNGSTQCYFHVRPNHGAYEMRTLPTTSTMTTMPRLIGCHCQPIYDVATTLKSRCPTDSTRRSRCAGVCRCGETGAPLYVAHTPGSLLTPIHYLNNDTKTDVDETEQTS